jgi:hypothetical protein
MTMTTMITAAITTQISSAIYTAVITESSEKTMYKINICTITPEKE